MNAESRLLCDSCNNGSLEVFAVCKCHKSLCIFLLDNDRHSLLRLRNCKLRAVKSLVFLGYFVKIDIKSVRKLSDSDRNTARAEVVASLYHSASLCVTEKPLELSFLGRISLLHLSSAGLDRVRVVRLARARRAAYAVASRSAAKQYYHVTVRGCFSADVLSGCRRYDRADLHSFCRVSRVIKLVDHTRCESYLVSVGRISRRRGLNDLSLWELSGNSLADGDRRVCRARNSHCRIYVATSRKRVTDSSADAGSRSSEGLDLCRVVVRLVLKEQEPILLHAVDRYLDLHGAGVDLLALVEFLELPRFL